MIPQLNLRDFDYYLPESAIAQFPLVERDKSKLLVADPNNNIIEHLIFNQISEKIAANSFMILNDTKVFSARIFFRKPTGGKVEVFCERPLSPSANFEEVLYKSCSPVVWECLVGGKKIRSGVVLEKKFEKDGDEFILQAEILDRKKDVAVVKFEWEGNYNFDEVLQVVGNTPLPPYVKREVIQADKETYQTVYAQKIGSIAAPTAGFHFTDKVIEALAKKGIEICKLTLHIGLGTFKPVVVEDISKHQMHFEDIFIEKSNLKQILHYLKNYPDGNIIAVGTTSLRILESLYWWAVKLFVEGKDFASSRIYLEKEEPYELMANYKTLGLREAFEYIFDICEKNKLNSLSGKTQLFIVPGYKFQTIDQLVTNFHLPKSTLIMLVSAFVGDKFWRKVYDEALANGYRFLSYGDSSLLTRKMN